MRSIGLIIHPYIVLYNSLVKKTILNIRTMRPLILTLLYIKSVLKNLIKNKKDFINQEDP